MITLTAKAAYGQSGQYLARLVGRHPRYTFDREFVGRKTGDRHERSEADLDAAGLYEVCDIDAHASKQQRYILILDVGHRLAEFACERTEAMKIAKAVGVGIAFTELVRAAPDGSGYEILTVAQAKREAQRADVARTIQAISDECWTILQALPTREALRVVGELKKRVKPPMTDQQPKRQLDAG